MSKMTTEHLGQQCEEIIRYLEKLRTQQKELTSQIQSTEIDVTKLDKEIEALSKKRGGLVATLDNKKRTLDVLDQTITEAEATYQKLMESSQTLLAFMKKEAFEVERSMNPSS